MLMMLTIWLMVLTPREGSKTDFILPPGHEERERERKKSSSLSMNRSAASFSTSNDPTMENVLEKSFTATNMIFIITITITITMIKAPTTTQR